MKIIMEKSIIHKMQDQIKEAEKNGKIEKLILTREEYEKMTNFVYTVLDASIVAAVDLAKTKYKNRTTFMGYPLEIEESQNEN